MRSLRSVLFILFISSLVVSCGAKAYIWEKIEEEKPISQSVMIHVEKDEISIVDTDVEVQIENLSEDDLHYNIEWMQIEKKVDGQWMLWTGPVDDGPTTGPAVDPIPPNAKHDLTVPLSKLLPHDLREAGGEYRVAMKYYFTKLQDPELAMSSGGLDPERIEWYRAEAPVKLK